MFGWGGGRRGGLSLAADKSTYLTSIAAGALIGTLNDPFGSGSTFAVVGSAPATLALASGGRIVAGAGAQSVGTSTIVIRVTNGQRAIEEPLTFTAQTSSIPTPAPVFTTQPSIGTDGTPQVGETMTASDGAASNTTTYTRRWLLAGTAVSTAANYAPTATGALILEVTATGPGGTKTATSSTVTVAAAPVNAPAFTSQPSVSGTPTVGQPMSSLTFTDGSVSNGSISSRAYLLGGASKALSYTFVAGDVGLPVTFRNTATGTDGSTISATSTPLSVVAASMLPVFRSAVSGVKAGNRRARVVCIGASSTEGAYSNVTAYGGTTPPTDLLLKAWPALLADLLAANGVPSNKDTWIGDGNIDRFGTWRSGYNPKLVVPAAWIVAGENAPGGHGSYTNTTSASMDYTPAAQVTTLEVFVQSYVNAPPLGYTVNGNAGTVAINSGEAGPIIKKVTVPAQAKGIKTFKILPTNGGYISVNGMIAYDAAVPAVDMLNVGWNAGRIADFASTSRGDSFAPGIAAFAPDLVIIEVAAFDSLLSTTLANYEASLRALVTRIKGYGADIMLVVSPPFQFGGADNHPTEAQRATYDAVVKSVASDNNLPVVDLPTLFGPWTTMQTNGLVRDTTQPNQPGYAQMAQFIYNAVAAQIGLTASTDNTRSDSSAAGSSVSGFMPAATNLATRMNALGA